MSIDGLFNLFSEIPEPHAPPTPIDLGPILPETPKRSPSLCRIRKRKRKLTPSLCFKTIYGNLCTICGKTPKTPHRHREAIYKCPVEGCKYETKLRPRQDLHYKSVHLKFKPWLCSLCSYRGAQSSDLVRHHFKHDRTVGVTCKSCSILFRNQIDYDEHNREHHRKIYTKARPFKCPTCNYRATTKNFLQLHISHSH